MATARVCEVDGKEYKNGSSFSHHKQVHSDQQFSCNVCPKKYKASRTLWYHKKTHEDSCSSHHCDQCKQEFQHLATLKRHIKAIHEKTKFTCAVADCGKEFHRKDILKKVHTTCRITKKKYETLQL